MDYRELTAPCGLDCFNCPLYLAQENEELRKKLAKRLGVEPEVAQCPGCRPRQGIISFMGMTQPCSVYSCAREKNLDLCCDCDDFPCDHLHPYADKADLYRHNTKVFNLALIKKMGLEEWAEQKAKSVIDTYFKGRFKL